MTKPRRTACVLAILTLTSGCDEDQRLIQQAQQASDRQAEQNRQIAHQNHELAEATNSLVTADAKAREETVAMQRELHQERAALDHKRDELENERRDLADERRRESLMVATLEGAVTLVACLLPLALAWYLLHGLRSGGTDEALGELLTIELSGKSDSPLLPPAKPLPSAVDGYLPPPDNHEAGPRKPVGELPP